MSNTSAHHGAGYIFQMHFLDIREFGALRVFLFAVQLVQMVTKCNKNRVYFPTCQTKHCAAEQNTSGP